VGEGEYYENIFFIKDGKLSLEAIIDLDNIESSIEKYLKYRFEEIGQIEDFSDHEDSRHKSLLKENNFIYNKIGKKRKIRIKTLIGLISKQFEKFDDIPDLHNLNFDLEIGKCDFQTELQDIYIGKIEYIHILDLLKNEFFGAILMFLNIPNPLSLKVKSKRAELYVLRKKDACNIRKDYQNIWQRINKKSIHNLKSLKSLTLGKINRYCEINGIIVKDNNIVKSNIKNTMMKYFSDKTNNFISNRKSKSNSIFNLSKNKTTFLTSFKHIDKKINNKKPLKIFKKLESNLKKEKEKENNKKNKEKGNNKSTNNDKWRKRKTLKENMETATSSFCTNNNSSQNKENKKKFRQSIIEHQKNSFANKNKRIKNMKNNNFTYLTQESLISLEITSSYENINIISKGQYINNNNFQILIKNIINNCIESNSKEKENNKSYLNEFNFAKKNIQFNKLNSCFLSASDKNCIYDNNLKVYDKNNNSISNKIIDKLSLENYISYYNNIKNKQKYNIKDKAIEKKNLNNIKHFKFNSNKITKNLDILSESNNNINGSNIKLKESNLKKEASQTFGKTKEIENNSKKDIEIKNNLTFGNAYSNGIIKNEVENNINEVNLNYVNNFCCIY